MAAAARLPNVTMLGAVRYAETGSLFDRAKIFLNTSSIEGFPNTFLQAWIRGVPVVTFFDPDSLVQRLSLGRAANSVDDMRESSAACCDNDAERQIDRAACTGIRHARIHHRSRRAIPRTTGSQLTAHASGRRPETQ